MRFIEPDMTRFPSLGLGWRALAAGGTMPAVLNAANEIAVEAFLSGEIRFTDIPRINLSVMEAHQTVAASSLEIILQADSWARDIATRTASTRIVAGMPQHPKGVS